jgi:LuxR family maltose regulon positive regulatory protein
MMRMDPIQIDSLTQREIEVLRLLDARLSNKEIATVLHISSGAVRSHTCRIYRKLGLRTRAYSGA